MSRSRERFAGFRSASDCPSLQPDPVVLAHLDRRVESFIHEAGSILLPEAFIGTMTDLFFEAFRRLDAIARESPFWAGTNRRPTLSKLGLACEASLRDDPTDLGALWLKVSVQTVGAWWFDPETWERLASSARVDPAWIVSAALYAEYFGSYETAPDLVRVLRRAEACAPVFPLLRKMILPRDPDRPDEKHPSRSRYLSNWARRVLEGWNPIGTEGITRHGRSPRPGIEPPRRPEA